MAIRGGREKCDELGIKNHVQCFVGDNCYYISDEFEQCLKSKGYIRLTNPSFFGTFNKTGRFEWPRSTYCNIVILMLNYEAVRRLAREKRVKLYSGMVIKNSAEIAYSDEDDLFKKIQGTLDKSQHGSDITYCEIDLKANASNPIKFPEDFECIIVDNDQTKARVESIVKSAGLNMQVYVSSFPAYR